MEIPEEEEQETEIQEQDDDAFLASDQWSPEPENYEIDEQNIEKLLPLFDKNEIDPYTSKHSESLQNLQKFRRFLLRMKKNHFYFIKNRTAPTCKAFNPRYSKPAGKGKSKIKIENTKAQIFCFCSCSSNRVCGIEVV